jgi:hypothetical protein
MFPMVVRIPFSPLSLLLLSALCSTHSTARLLMVPASRSWPKPFPAYATRAALVTDFTGRHFWYLQFSKTPSSNIIQGGSKNRRHPSSCCNSQMGHFFAVWWVKVSPVLTLLLGR